jgi:N-acetylglucosaminyldiphosphoundecaprenol N-acetyl-beta-D-mannosaminyltransferase
MTNVLKAQAADPSTLTNWPEKVDLIGVRVSIVDYQSAVDSIFEAIHNGENGIVSCHAVHAIVTMSCDQGLLEKVNQFMMITPDGQPVRWAMNLLHKTGLKDRVYGPELMIRLCQRAANEQTPVYFYGGDEKVSRDLVDSIQRQFPGIVIAGAEAPPFRPLTAEEDEQVIKRINESGAGIVFIGLGCPKQDQFAHEHRHQLNAIQVCVGAAFDFHAGAKPMAPMWMQRSGFEWLYRLSKEPGRLWRRYLVTNSLYVWKVAKEFVFGSKKRDSEWNVD